MHKILENTQQKNRITFLLTQDIESPSGLGRYFPWSKYLVKHGFKVTIAALHPNFHSLENKFFWKEGVKISYVAQMHVKKEGNQTEYFRPLGLLFYTIVATWNLLSYSVKNPVDFFVIGKPHPMNSIAGLIGGFLKRAKIILDCDDYEAASNYFSSRWQRWVIRLFENNMPKYVHRIVTNTLFNKERMANLGVQKEKIYYLPNGVDEERFTIIDKQTTKDIINKIKLSDHKVIAFIGSLNLENHPVDLVINAFSEIKAVFSNTKLLIVGGGKDINTLKSLVNDLGFNEDIIFTGRVSPSLVPHFYQIAAVSVDPVYDTNEAKGRCPLKMFESWAMNTPFVTADVGDRRALAGAYSRNILALPGDHHDLAIKIMAILSDSELASRLSAFYRESVEEYFWDKIVAKNLHIFNIS